MQPPSRAFVATLLLTLSIVSPAPLPAEIVGPGPRPDETSAAQFLRPLVAASACPNGHVLNYVLPPSVQSAAPRAIAIRGDNVLLTVSGTSMLQAADSHIYEVNKFTGAFVAAHDMSPWIGQREIGALCSDGGSGWWAGEYGLSSSQTPRVFHINGAFAVDQAFDTGRALTRTVCYGGGDGGIDGIAFDGVDRLFISTDAHPTVHAFKTDGTDLGVSFTQPYEVTGHAWDPTTGHLLLMDLDACDVHEVNPLTGADIRCFYLGYALNCTLGRPFLEDLERDSDGTYYWFGNANGQTGGNFFGTFRMELGTQPAPPAPPLALTPGGGRNNGSPDPCPRDGVPCAMLTFSLRQDSETSLRVTSGPEPGQKPELIVDLRAPMSVRLDLYDLLGRHVSNLLQQGLPTGRTIVQWDGRERNGGVARAGVYVARLVLPDEQHVTAFVLNR